MTGFPLRILILEDVKTDAELAQLQIEELEMSVEFQVIAKQEEYIHSIQTFKPDLIISDFNLPKFDGLKALKILRENDDITPFIFLTGTLGEETAVQAIKSGATDFIVKNRISQLPAAIVRALRERDETRAKKDTENRFKSLVQKGSELIAIADYDGNFSFVSDNSQAIIGFEVDEMITSSFYEFVHPEDLRRVQSAFNKIKKSSTITIKPYRLKKATEEWGWFECILTNLYAEPAVNGVVINAREVTHLVEKEQELQLSHERYRLATLATQDLIYDWNLVNGVVVRDAGAMKRMFGYATEETEQPAFWKRKVHPDDVKVTFRSLHEKLEDPDAVFHECRYRFRHADGYYMYLHDKGHIIRDKNGKAIRLIGATRDITEQRNKEIQQELILTVSRIMNREKELKLAFTLILERLVKAIEVNFGELWLPSLYNGHLNLLCSYGIDSTEQTFHQLAPHSTFVKGEGLAGTVWAEADKKIWKIPQSVFLRKSAADATGLKCACGIPVIFGDQVLAVFIFFSKEEDWKINSFESILSGVCQHLAPDLQRKFTEDELNSFFTLSTDLMCVITREGLFKKVNPAFTTILGYTEDEMLNADLSKVIHPDDLMPTLEGLRKLANGSTLSGHENRYITLDGRVRWFYWSATNIQEGLVLGTGKDITEQKIFQQSLLENTIQSQEEERNRIAKDLHDGIVQELVACSMKSEVMLTLFNNPDRLKRQTKDLGQLLKKVAKDTREISHNLLSADLRTMSFKELVEQLQIKLNSYSDIHFSFSCHFSESPLDDKVKTNLYRCLQELTNNIIKHSKATTAFVSIEEVGDVLYLTVRDNGVGVQSGGDHLGIGLSNIKSRVLTIGGRLQIRDLEIGGLEVSIEIPL